MATHGSQDACVQGSCDSRPWVPIVGVILHLALSPQELNPGPFSGKAGHILVHTVKSAINDTRHNDNLGIAISFAATVPFVWGFQQYNDILAIEIYDQKFGQFCMVIVITVWW